MANPVSPVVPGHKLAEVVYGEGQEAYQALPAIRNADGAVLSRWRLTLRERLTVLLRGEIYLWQMTLNAPLQPVLIEVERPTVQTGVEVKENTEV